MLKAGNGERISKLSHVGCIFLKEISKFLQKESVQKVEQQTEGELKFAIKKRKKHQFVLMVQAAFRTARGSLTEVFCKTQFPEKFHQILKRTPKSAFF